MMVAMGTRKMGWDSNDSRLGLRSWLTRGMRETVSYRFMKDPSCAIFFLVAHPSPEENYARHRSFVNP
jgi:hypothetical protein